MSDQVVLYCSKDGCVKEAIWMVEGDSLCDAHLVTFFTDTTLDIKRVGRK